MRAPGPTYLRNNDVIPPFGTQQNVDDNGGDVDDDDDDDDVGRTEVKSDLHVTGLRALRLRLLLIGLTLITLITLVVLILNIFIIRSLRMSTRGMKNLQFHSRQDLRTGEEEKIMQLTAENVHLGRVIAKSGLVSGSSGRDLTIEGSRVIIRGAPNRSQLVLQDGICRLENVDDFVVRNENRPYFSAQHPTFRIDRRVKKISTAQILTNKVRSPVNDNLYVDAVDLGLRGNEGVHLESKRINLTAKTAITMQTTADGRLHVNGEKLFIGNSLRTLPLSTSPALTASIDALRVCICMAPKPKLFTVAGNKPCSAPHSFCT